jgi:hypothetical protein
MKHVRSSIGILGAAALLITAAAAHAQVAIRSPGVRPSCSAGLGLGVRYDSSTGPSARHVTISVTSGARRIYRRELTATTHGVYWTIHPTCGRRYIVTYATPTGVSRIPVTLSR